MKFLSFYFPYIRKFRKKLKVVLPRFCAWIITYFLWSMYNYILEVSKFGFRKWGKLSILQIRKFLNTIQKPQEII